MICKNCGHNFEGNFCSNCGQNCKVQKINFTYLVDEISDSVFQVNSGLFFTVKELSTRPGHTIRQYLEGKRKPHFKPLAFVLLLSALYVFSTYLSDTNTFLGDFISGISSGISNGINDDGQPSAMAIVLNWMINNYAYSTLLLLPFFSFASYLVFRKEKYNYFEHLILNSYISGQQIIIYIVFSILYYVTNSEIYWLESIPILLGIIYTFWTFLQFFETKKYFLKILLTLLVYILYTILLTLFLSVLIIWKS